jgi:hypothetical protein
MKTTAWAVVDHNGINVRTVSDTRRAAIVNWLCDNTAFRLTQATNENIEKMWTETAGKAVVHDGDDRTHGVGP